MNLSIATPINLNRFGRLPRLGRLPKLPLALTACALLVTACGGGGSGDSVPATVSDINVTDNGASQVGDVVSSSVDVMADNSSANDVPLAPIVPLTPSAPAVSPPTTVDVDETTLIEQAPSLPDSIESGLENRVTAEFDITVPEYVSNELQVTVVWGDRVLPAAWVRDESWSVIDNLPADTEAQLVVTFFDQNGGIVLGTVEQTLRTGTTETATYRISADQFDSNRWDDDGDGISNLDELRAGSDPLVVSASELQPVQASLEILPIKIFRLRWQPSAGAQFYRVLENPDGVSGYQLISNDLDASAQSYDHEVALFSRFNARYIVQACNASGCVDSAEQAVSGTLESAVGYFKPEATDTTGVGGQVVLSADGNTLATTGSNQTHVYVKENGSWQRQATLAAGGNISLSADGNTIAAGGTLFRGSYTVFVRRNGNWSQQAQLNAVNAAGDVVEEANRSLSISADGNTLVVGIEDDDSIGELMGAAYVFVRNGESWEQQAQLLADPDDTSISSNVVARFGHKVSINAAGDTVAVSAENEVRTGFITGVVHVFVKVNGDWQRQAALVGRTVESRTGFGTSLFGGYARSLNLSADGNLLAVGSIEDHAATDSIVRAGAVYLYERNNGTWQQQGYVQASNPPQSTNSSFNGGNSHGFGGIISLSADGNVLAVGAAGERSTATGINGDQTQSGDLRFSGAVYVFTQANGSWQQKAYVKALAPHGSLFFGLSVSLDADGETLAVGASGDRSGATGLNGNPFGFTGPRNGAFFLY